MNVSVEKLRKYAEEHGFMLTPFPVIEGWVKKMNELGHCKCSSERPECPCWQCEIEVRKTGVCRCHLVMSKEYAERLKK